MLSSRSLWTGLSLGLLTFSPLGAQTSSSAADDPRTTVDDEVTVEGKAPEPSALMGVASRLGAAPDELPTSFTALDQATLDAQNATTLTDALENVPGVNPQPTGTFDGFFIRGFESVAGTLLLSDGAREPESTILHMYNVERVEVLRGAAGFLYGGRALAGTVNLVRKRPTAGSFAQADLEFGEDGLFETSFDVNRDVSEVFGFRLNGVYKESDGFRDGQASEAWAIHPTLRWTWEKTAIDLGWEVGSNDYAPDAGIPLLDAQIPGLARLADVPRTTSYASPFDTSEQDVHRIQLNLEHRWNDALSFRQKVYYSSLDWQTRGTVLAGTFSFPPFIPEPQVVRTLTSLDDKQTFYGTQAELTFDVETGPVRHQIVAGVELSRFEDDLLFGINLLDSVPVAAPVQTGRIGPAIPTEARFGDVETDVVAPFVVDRMSIGERLEVWLGARYDDLSTGATGTVGEREASDWSPLAGVVVDLTEDVSVYASYGESFEPPSTLTAGAPEPEEGEQLEVGARFRLFDGRLSASIAAFDLEKTNIAIPDATGFARQVGSQVSEGVEVQVEGDVRPGVNLLVSYAYTDAEFEALTEIVQVGQGAFLVVDRAGNTPPFVPEHLARLWVRHELPAGFGLGAGLRYVGDQFIAPDNAFELDSYLLVDANLSWQRDRLQLRLDLSNLTDEEYEVRAFGLGAVRPMPGFQVRGGVRYTL
ncbi:MAG: TonB-dependent receptor [Acidobacteriota bacterium]